MRHKSKEYKPKIKSSIIKVIILIAKIEKDRRILLRKILLSVEYYYRK